MATSDQCLQEVRSLSTSILLLRSAITSQESYLRDMARQLSKDMQALSDRLEALESPQKSEVSRMVPRYEWEEVK